MPEAFRLVADKGQLETVLVNVAANSRDAMPSGGRITFSAVRQTVEPEATGDTGLSSGSYIVIAVADTGCGMDQATLTRASEPFFTTKGVGRELASAWPLREVSLNNPAVVCISRARETLERPCRYGCRRRGHRSC